MNCYSETESDDADWVGDEDLLSDLEMPDDVRDKNRSLIHSLIEYRWYKLFWSMWWRRW